MKKTYPLRNREQKQPLTTSTPPNNFDNSLDPKTNNNIKPPNGSTYKTNVDSSSTSTKIGYNIVEDMKKIKANITLHELNQITKQRELLFESVSKKPGKLPKAINANVAM